MKKLIGMLALGFMVNAYAVVNPNSNFAYVDLLFWQCREGGADNWAQIITPAGIQRTAKPIDAPFNWNEGIRLGAGHSFNPSDDIVLILTHYNTKANSQASGIVYSSFLANYFANNTNGANFGPSYQSATIRWNIFYNTADIDLGHHFNLDRFLQLHPHVGFKVAEINQTVYTNWLNPTTTTDFTAATENLKNNFWGIGPSIGIDMTWPIFCWEQQSFNLVGNVATALVWGHWSFKDIYNNNKPVTITSHVSSVNGLSPMLGGLLGIEWMKHLTKWDFSIRLGYEEQVWFNQLQFYTLDMGRVNRSLSFQGGNLEFKFVIK